MKQIVVAAFVGIMLLLGAAYGDQALALGTANTPKPDGEKIYKVYCITCHGMKGDMGASGAANLSASTLPLEGRIKVIGEGRNTMTGFKALLTPDKIKAVAKYTLELKKKS